MKGLIWKKESIVWKCLQRFTVGIVQIVVVFCLGLLKKEYFTECLCCDYNRIHSMNVHLKNHFLAICCTFPAGRHLGQCLVIQCF